MHRYAESYVGAEFPEEKPRRAWNLCNADLIEARVSQVGLSVDDSTLCVKALHDFRLYLEKHRSRFKHCELNLYY